VKIGGIMSNQLVKGFTNEELWNKAEYEGIDYLFLDYLDINSILNYNLRKAVEQYISAFEEIQNILEEYEPEEEE
jgi:uncharacterized radical SAM superfamily protein